MNMPTMYSHNQDSTFADEDAINEHTESGRQMSLDELSLVGGGQDTATLG